MINIHFINNWGYCGWHLIVFSLSYEDKGLIIGFFNFGIVISFNKK